MKRLIIYQPGTQGRRTVFVQPGTKYQNSEFMNEDGTPKMFNVTFTEGQATVDSELGRYMIDSGIAKSSPIILFGN